MNINSFIHIGYLIRLKVNLIGRIIVFYLLIRWIENILEKLRFIEFGPRDCKTLAKIILSIILMMEPIERAVHLFKIVISTYMDLKNFPDLQ